MTWWTLPKSGVSYLGGDTPPVAGAQQSAAPVNADAAAVPIERSVDEVLAWVGDDAGRAGQALRAEQAQDAPRSTLVDKLDRLAMGDPA